MSVAAVVLTVAVCGLSGSMVSSVALDRVNHETALAEAAVRGTMERIGGTTFSETFARFNADPTDDPGGPGTAPGATFAVPGLHGVGNALPGRITFPVSAPGVLREDVDDPKLGMPRDLNGDGAIDEISHATNYRLLPVRVSVTWRGVRGVRTLTVESMLCAH